MITLVTGLWDIGRGNLNEGWSRSYQHYLEKFSKLLDVEENMIIFGDQELQEFVFRKRNHTNEKGHIRYEINHDRAHFMHTNNFGNSSICGYAYLP